MDPNEALRLVREARQAMQDAPGTDMYLNAAERFAGHVADLDEWLSRGGFLPDAWQRPREYSYESEDVNGRAGTVTYTVPAGVPVASEVDASDNAIDTRWTYPPPSLPAEYSAVGMTDPKWAARLAREAQTVNRMDADNRYHDCPTLNGPCGCPTTGVRAE